MQIHFLRHATLILKLNNHQLLVDPMFSRAGSMDPVRNAASQKRIPLVELPMSEVALNLALRQIDAVFVTHTHFDHWDARAIEMLPKSLPVFCQPGDESRIRGNGFNSVIPIREEHAWEGITIHRTGGRHGTGEIGQKMGSVSGFVLRAETEPTIYIAGDTIWSPEVADAIQSHGPDVIVVNAGGTRFLTGGPITMTAEDVASVCRARPEARVVAVHMEAVNHCVMTRAMLRKSLQEENLMEQVLIPSDGDLQDF